MGEIADIGGARGHAEYGDASALYLRGARRQVVDHPPVRMAVQDRLGAALLDDRNEGARVKQAAQQRARAVGERRMMDHDDPRKAPLSGLLQKLREGCKLRLAEPARGQDRRGRNARVQADQRDFAAHPQIGEAAFARVTLSSRARTSGASPAIACGT